MYNMFNKCLFEVPIPLQINTFCSVAQQSNYMPIEKIRKTNTLC